MKTHGDMGADYENDRLRQMLAAAEKENRELRESAEGARAIVDEQAEEDGLWFIAESVVEAFFQQELRRLHAAVEAIPLAARGA